MLVKNQTEMNDKNKIENVWATCLIKLVWIEKQSVPHNVGEKGF